MLQRKGRRGNGYRKYCRNQIKDDCSKLRENDELLEGVMTDCLVVHSIDNNPFFGGGHMD